MDKILGSIVLIALAGFALAGCPSSTTETGGDSGLDAGASDAGGSDAARVDAGNDASVGDAGANDGSSDVGTDAAMPATDAGTDAAITGDAGIDAPSANDAGTDAGPCSPACGISRACCGGACLYTYNDPRNCGSCGHTCAASEYCEAGSCVPRPCTATCGSGLCCGSACCAVGQICCDPAGPVSGGPQCTTPNASGTCPAGCAPLCTCASPDTMIATPNGERPIADLAAGDLVYSAERGALVAVPLAAVHRTWVGGDHRMVRVALETGRVLEISPGHPTADGRFFSDLRAGELLDGARVVSVELVPYGHDYTYDVLPASETATYVAGGVLIGSTLAPAGAPIALVAEAE